MHIYIYIICFYLFECYNYKQSIIAKMKQRNRQDLIKTNSRTCARDVVIQNVRNATTSIEHTTGGTCATG